MLGVGLSLGAAATYVFLYAYRHDDGLFSYAELYSMAMAATTLAFAATWLATATWWAKPRLPVVEVDLSRPPGLGETSQARGLAVGTAAGFVAIGVLVAAVAAFLFWGEGYAMVSISLLASGLVLALAGAGIGISAAG